MLLAGAILGQLAGVALLRSAQVRASGLLLAAALVTLLGSIALLSSSLGWEIAAAWGLTSISLVAYGLILHPLTRAERIGQPRAPRDGRRNPASPSGSKMRLAVKLFSAGPLYLIAALAVSLLIATRPWTTEVSRLYTGGLTTPLFWSMGALHATVDPSLWRVTFVPAALGVAGFAAFFLS